MPTRPDGSGEPSFPSTHVMVVSTIFFCVSAALPKYIKSKVALFLIYLVMFVLASLVATGRIVSGKHSCIDVIGAAIFAFIFYEIYYYCIHHNKSKKEKKDA
jgi:undecaprenyl-diphosphatase